MSRTKHFNHDFEFNTGVARARRPVAVAEFLKTDRLTYDAGPTRDLAGEAYVWFQALRRGSNGSG